MRPWHWDGIEFSNCPYVHHESLYVSHVTINVFTFCPISKISPRPHLVKFGIGAAHHFNWKKIGLSEEYFKSQRVCEETMPTLKAKAAFIFIRDNNVSYQKLLDFTTSGLGHSRTGTYVFVRSVHCPSRHWVCHVPAFVSFVPVHWHRYLATVLGGNCRSH